MTDVLQNLLATGNSFSFRVVHVLSIHCVTTLLKLSFIVLQLLLKALLNGGTLFELISSS